MASYNNLKATVKAAIKINGTQAINGQVLQNQLISMIDKLGAGYQFGDVVNPGDSFNSAKYGDTKVFFIAFTPGTYSQFGNFTVLSGQVVLFLYDGSWRKQVVSYYGNTQVYGVRHFYNEASPDLTRIGDASLHQELPVQSKMRRCVVNDQGAVVYYLSENDSTKKVDGTDADLSGADGQVMVEIPAHYRKCSLNSTQGYMDVQVSLEPFEGAIRVPRYLVSAYEATVDRSTDTLKLASVKNTTAAFRGGNNNGDWDDSYRSLLGLPATNISLTDFRTYGRNRGTGWGCYDWNAHLAIYWLFVIEYATLNSQKAYDGDLDANGYHKGGLGPGVSDFSGWDTYNSYNPIVPCGVTNTLGNKTGVVDYVFDEAQVEAHGAEYTAHVPSYRGIENPFGHIWKWTDGVLGLGVNGEYQEIYVCRDPEKYSSTITDDYKDIGHEATANGYCKAILPSGPDVAGKYDQSVRVYGDIFDRDDSGSYDTYFCDYHYHANSDGSVYGALVGGNANLGVNDGLAYVDVPYGPASASAYIGSRLCWSE